MIRQLIKKADEHFFINNDGNLNRENWKEIHLYYEKKDYKMKNWNDMIDHLEGHNYKCDPWMFIDNIVVIIPKETYTILLRVEKLKKLQEIEV